MRANIVNERSRIEIQSDSLLDRIGALVSLAGLLWVVVVVGWLITIYALTYFLLLGAFSAEISLYLFQPLLWCYLAMAAFLGWRYGLKERPCFNRPLVLMAMLFGLGQVAISVIAGLFAGFGRSPYDHRAVALLGNLLYVGAMLVGMELARAYLVSALGRRRPLLALVLVCLFFSLLSTPFGKFGRLTSPQSAIEVVGEMFLPTLSENLLATFLAFLGGPLASIAYRGMLQAFEWLSPILPNLRWTMTTFLGTLVPAFGLMAIHQQFVAQSASEGTDESRNRSSVTAWVVVAVVAVVLLGFNTGLFGVRPSLVASGSMTPTLAVGDLVITRDVEPGAVRVGDIIRFWQGNAYYIHRVVDIQKQGQQITFITRGDANNVDDPPVPASNLAGKVVLTIPKLGWVAIAVRKGLAWIL